jgi:hypothetical protein
VLTAMPVAGALDALEDVEGVAAGALELELELLLLPHAATTNATPTRAATPPPRDFALLRLVIVLLPLSGFPGPVSRAGHQHRHPSRADPSRWASTDTQPALRRLDAPEARGRRPWTRAFTDTRGFLANGLSRYRSGQASRATPEPAGLPRSLPSANGPATPERSGHMPTRLPTARPVRRRRDRGQEVARRAGVTRALNGRETADRLPRRAPVEPKTARWAVRARRGTFDQPAEARRS